MKIKRYFDSSSDPSGRHKTVLDVPVIGGRAVVYCTCKGFRFRETCWHCDVMQAEHAFSELTAARQKQSNLEELRQDFLIFSAEFMRRLEEAI